MAYQENNSVRAAATLVYGASNRFDFKDAKNFLLKNMQKAIEEGQPPCLIYQEALKGLLQEDQIVKQNIVSNYALVRTDKIKSLEELTEENLKLSKQLRSSNRQVSKTEKTMWFCFGMTGLGILLQLIKVLGLILI